MQKKQHQRTIKKTINPEFSDTFCWLHHPPCFKYLLFVRNKLETPPVLHLLLHTSSMTGYFCLIRSNSPPEPRKAGTPAEVLMPATARTRWVRPLISLLQSHQPLYGGRRERQPQVGEWVSHPALAPATTTMPLVSCCCSRWMSDGASPAPSTTALTVRNGTPSIDASMTTREACQECRAGLRAMDCSVSPSGKAELRSRTKPRRFSGHSGRSEVRGTPQGRPTKHHVSPTFTPPKDHKVGPALLLSQHPWAFSLQMTLCGRMR